MTIATVVTEDLDLIYQQLVAELGDPYNNAEMDEADARYTESKTALTKYVQDMYLAQIKQEPVTVEIPMIKPSPYRKRKNKGH